jgi:transketolase
VSAPTPNSYRIGLEDLPVFDNRVAFADTLIELATNDERIVAVCNDSVGSSNLTKFRDLFPDRLINVGIAEQNMVGVGAGLANAGLVPFVCAAGPFLTGRALEQIKADVAYSNIPVILCGMSPGMAYGELGPTHHSVEDLSWLRALPGLDIVIPVDEAQTAKAVRWAVEAKRPMYLRVGRHKVPNVTTQATGFELGKWNQLAAGTDVTIVAAGSMVSRAMAAVHLLAEVGVSAAVLNATFIAPLDIAALRASASSTRAIVTVEEANIAGGLGAAVASAMGQFDSSARVPLRILGTDHWAPTFSTDGLYEHFGLTAEGITSAALEVLARD